MRPAFILSAFTLALAAIGFAAGDELGSLKPARRTAARPVNGPVTKSTAPKAAVAQAGDKPADKPTAKADTKPAPQAPAAPATDSDANAAEEAAIRQMGESFARAYGEGDASAVAAHFTADAEYVDEQGDVFEGRQAIEEELTTFFAENPGCQLEIDISTIRFVSPGVAVEDGSTTVMRPEGVATYSSRYTTVHVKTAGKWLAASVREHAPKDRREHRAQLQQLEWLVGDWVDEDDDSIIEFTCQAIDKGNFLLRQFIVKIVGQEVMSGTQRIGWDPLTGKLRTWIFDSEGGYGEGTWHRDGDRWVLKTSGVTADGQATTGTSIYTLVNAHSMTWQAVDHEVAGVQLPDSELVTIVRRPPAPELIDNP